MTLTLNLDNSAAESSTRRTLASLSLAVAKSKKIVVVTGAGISCSCGIPDFRSSDGLYALVKQQYPDVVLKGRDLFDASLFRDSTSTAVFYTFIAQLKQSIDKASPSPTHRFIKTLDSKRKLLRSYTQNIDGLEERAGLLGSASQNAKCTGKGKAKIRAKDVRNVQLHGDIHRVRCTFCSAEFPCIEEYVKSFDIGTAPDCPECTTRSAARQARSARALKVGTLRPAIVLYDEPHPLGDDIGSIQSTDITRKPDMLIIMGTSLKVHGFKKLVKDFAKTVRESAPPNYSPMKSPKGTKSWAGKVIFVNKSAPGSEWDGIIDYHVEGETDKWCEKVIEDWKKARPADWEVQTKLDATGGEEDFAGFKVMKEMTNATSAKPKAPKKAARENKPPAVEDIQPPKDTTTLSPPPSPSKRRNSGCHYSDGECSPSKKRASRGLEKLDFEGRGMLFGDATNIPDKEVDVEDVFGELVAEQVKGRPKSRAGGATMPRPAKQKVEVAMKLRESGRRTVAASRAARTM
ncbi:hypothetical protein PHLCEN_2v2741 [Hermanssonia centrifuga]|uniref:Deacetylase sirtuin-type domain-containing protein n=1 Tax=Hermanssonia centrifuga TaxID=98765 RepID=A0A2R6RHU9_9APHY|nr:hypothetical protein PHLCEN_2v2741 [Hermanssonia centrifuga]